MTRSPMSSRIRHADIHVRSKSGGDVAEPSSGVAVVVVIESISMSAPFVVSCARRTPRVLALAEPPASRLQLREVLVAPLAPGGPAGAGHRSRGRRTRGQLVLAPPRLDAADLARDRLRQLVELQDRKSVV